MKAPQTTNLDSRYAKSSAEQATLTVSPAAYSSFLSCENFIPRNVCLSERKLWDLLLEEQKTDLKE